jgi:hypothetical protein
MTRFRRSKMKTGESVDAEIPHIRSVFIKSVFIVLCITHHRKGTSIISIKDI